MCDQRKFILTTKYALYALFVEAPVVLVAFCVNFGSSDDDEDKTPPH